MGNGTRSVRFKDLCGIALQNGLHGGDRDWEKDWATGGGTNEIEDPSVKSNF